MTTIPSGLPARRTVRAVAVAFLLLASFAGSGGDCSSEPIPPQTWRLVGDRIEIPGLHSQGIASLPAFGSTDRVYTSRFTMDRVRGGRIQVFGQPLAGAPAQAGFDHVGDIDALGTLVYAPLEDLDNTQVPYRRGFAVYDATTLELLGGSLNTGSSTRPADGDNAWVAVSPDGRWLLNSEWNPQDSLTVWAVDEIGVLDDIEPVLEIPLTRTIRRIQGCDFDGPQVLVCASDDGDAGNPAYAIVLTAPLAGAVLPPGLTGAVSELFPIPVPGSGCGVDPEVEGIDVDGDELRIMVIGSCLVDTHTYRWVRDRTSG